MSASPNGVCCPCPLGFEVDMGTRLSSCGHRGHGLCHRVLVNDMILIKVDDLRLVVALRGSEGLVSAPQLLVLDCGRAGDCYAGSQGTVLEQEGLCPWHTVTPAQIGIRKAHSVTSGISCMLWEA